MLRPATALLGLIGNRITSTSKVRAKHLSKAVVGSRQACLAALLRTLQLTPTSVDRTPGPSPVHDVFEMAARPCLTNLFLLALGPAHAGLAMRPDASSTDKLSGLFTRLYECLVLSTSRQIRCKP